MIPSLVALCLAEPVIAADVSGTSTLRLTTIEGESAARASVTLKQDGQTLTGSREIVGTDEKFTVVGEVTAKAVRFNGPSYTGRDERDRIPRGARVRVDVVAVSEEGGRTEIREHDSRVWRRGAELLDSAPLLRPLSTILSERRP